MDKFKIAEAIENYAPLELAESWDCCGWSVDSETRDIKKVMLALTVTDDVVEHAKKCGCEMIISHHPLFYVPLEWKNINIYSAHTNMDKTSGGTTDKLIETLGFESNFAIGEFVKVCNFDNGILLEDLIGRLKKISPNLRYVNNKKESKFYKVAFCAGSGSEFIRDSYNSGADAFVTGDLKFHTALESPIAIFDVGHFESEIMILEVFEKLLSSKVDIIKAIEKTPFIQTKS